MSLNVNTLVRAMVGAAKPALQKKWKEARDFAESEAKKTAETLALIGRLTAAGKIKEERAKLLLQMQKNATLSVLMAIEGIGVVAAQQAINNAMDAVRTTVNKSVGFALL